MSKNLARAFMIFCALSMLAGASGATSYEFGSKVRVGDTDVNDPLIPINLTVRFIDLGPPGLDTNDIAYLAQGLTMVIPSDIRLTPFAGYLAGTRVRAIDTDVYVPTIPTNGKFVFSNLFGIPAWPDIEDPVYYINNTTSAMPIGIADLRLTRLQGLNPGTWTKDSDLDFNNPTLLLPGNLNYCDRNGNLIYDNSDALYWDMPTVIGAVSPGDLRLTAISGNS